MSISYDHDHENEINFFALTNFRHQRRKFGIKTDDRRRHMYVIGKTGMGKTTMLENLIVNDINAGHGVGVVDPHGDTAEKLLDYIPANRINDVVYFNPADSEFPVAFNVLEAVNPLHKHLVAQGLMGVFKKIWPDVWSARMEHILNNCILALLDYSGSTLLGINRLLVDKTFRRRVVTKIRDPIVKAFWVDEYQVWEARFRNEAIQPIQNKVGQFLSASIIRNIVAQVKSTLDMRTIMDSGKIFIMNLSKGRLGEDTSRLLGGMLITKMQLAAMERVDIPEPERRDFYLYVDEFQNFATESFANILSEARKYRLNLTIAHQYIGQLITDVSTKVRDAVFGNVGTIVMFRIGAEDAEFVALEFAPHFVEEDMVNLAKYDVYLKLMIDGVTSSPFSAITLPPVAQLQGHREKIIKVSRERYAVPASEVEDKVMRWTGMGELEEESEMHLGAAPSQLQGSSSVPPFAKGGTEDLPAQADARSAARIQRRDASHKDEGGERGTGLRVSVAGSHPAFPKGKKEEEIRMEETVPVAKVAAGIKPISLQEAMQKKPVLIKLGPQKNFSLPPKPQPQQGQPQRRDQHAHDRSSQLFQGQPQPRPPQPQQSTQQQKPSQQPQPQRQSQRSRDQGPPQPRQNVSPKREHVGGQAPRQPQSPQFLKPGEIVRFDQDQHGNHEK